MAKKKKSDKKKANPGWDDAPKETFHNPFAALKGAKEDLPPGPDLTEEEPEGAATGEPQAPKRAVVRAERKGRGGKTVTVVSHLDLSADRLEAWCGDLRKTLGVGGTVEGDTLVLQGDQRDRAVEALKAMGVGKVSVG